MLLLVVAVSLLRSFTATSVIDNTAGSAEVSQAILSPPAPTATLSGDVTLFRIRFDVVGIGKTGLTISNDLVIDPLVTPNSLKHTTVQGSFDSTGVPDSIAGTMLGFNVNFTFTPNPEVPGSPLTLIGQAHCAGCSGALLFSWDTDSIQGYPDPTAPAATIEATGSSATITGPTATHRVTLIVSDTAGHVAQATRRLVPSTSALAVTMHCPSTGTVGTIVSCTAFPTGGTPPYSLGWMAGGGSPDSGTGSSFSTTFSTTGSHLVSVILTDSTSQVAVAFAEVVIGSSTVSVIINCSPTGTVGIAVSCSATGSGGSSPFTFAWTANGASPSVGSGPSFSATYSTMGTYTIRVTFTDSASHTATDSATVTISPLAFTVSVNCPATSVVGTAVSCSATGSGGTLPNTFAWTASGGSPSSGTGSSFSTIYPTVGTYTISVTGKDSSSPPNSQTQSATVTISVVTLATASTTNQKTVFQFPSERAMFYAQGRTWIFFTSNQMGTVIPVYATSTDGQTWAQYSITSIAAASANSSTPISAITNGTHVFLAWYQGSYPVMSKALLIGIGRLNSDGTIAWNLAITAVPSTAGQRWYDPNLSLNADGTLFLSYRNATSTDGGGFAFATTASAPYTSWSPPFTLKASADTWRTSWINLNNGQEYVLYSPAGGCLRGRLYDGGFGSEEIICNPASTRYVAFGFDNDTNTPTVIYQESNTERLMITYRVGGIWQTPRLIGYAETNSLPQWTVTFVPSLAKYYLIYYNYTTGSIWDYNGNANSWSTRTLLVNSVRGNSSMSIISYPIAGDLTTQSSIGFAWTNGDASTNRVLDINFGTVTLDAGPTISRSLTQLSIRSSAHCCQPSLYLPWILVGLIATMTLTIVIVDRKR